VGIGLPQRLVLWPLVTLLPKKRSALVRGWLRFHAGATIWLARVFANVRVVARGTAGPESCVVLMNHQSLLDIPIAFRLVPGPYAVIPTRALYFRGIPGISPLLRISRFPSVSRGKGAARGELRALKDAAAQVARGERSMVIYPEGHRTRDGEISEFMKTGLKLILRHSRSPVYVAVLDGLWQARTFGESIRRFADKSAQVVVLGPFPPPEPEAIDAFVDDMRERMKQTLADIRSGAAETAGGPARLLP
jgi:1-acyl-sn-glycerol-3-phosphate acyltransferase